MHFASYFDHTDLRPQASREDIYKLCRQAAYHEMAAVCIQPYRVPLAYHLLRDSPIKVCTVIAFPFGADNVANKVQQAVHALEDGAEEIDMVMNIGALKDRQYSVIKHEIEALLALRRDYSFILKVIVETALLSTEELKQLTCLLNDSGADYIKTSTGFSHRGVSLEDIQTIARYRVPPLKIKASGGIRDLSFALTLIAAGADRLGCSCSQQIIQAYEAQHRG